MHTGIRPGQVWLDTNGNRIQAHGGSIITDRSGTLWTPHRQLECTYNSIPIAPSPSNRSWNWP